LNFFSLFKRNIFYKLKKKILIDIDKVEGKSLDKLFQFYGSDKGNYFEAGNTKGHGYSDFYTSQLDNLKDNKINILEIGSYAGSSAAAFVKYFSKANIFCLDINISNFKYKSEKIHVYGIDIKNLSKVKKTLNKIFQENHINNFDIIIDDGSHNLKDILLTLNFFFRYLKKNGTFIIEDFKHPNYYQYNRNLNHILLDEFLENIEKKKISNSSIFTEEDQIYLINSIKNINIKKGNLIDSDICFIEKK
jgi:ubiquinone/menaquinone biosynthesis C-methylase UbiE